MLWKEDDQQKPLLCPRCGGKTRLNLRKDTELKNFLLFCPKCKQETLVNVKDFKVITI
ncbi:MULTISPECIES: cysteine-rich KTR domain-containing protein [unclassified Anaerostipes]|jgi:Zn finger protein HypA/HybF involved in hydrogenase expression|uniref:cysteine-rich KTR domain-containing protein n=1 Tax=unclassified Anaerostipes TaxID=2635253 RepID=UPI001BA57A40|nr:cysteine-rich KTR domain-containing protein [Anaerostipes sp. Marseille-Q3525]MBR9962275.1 cysteine-rich KTR domain-containing protein [Anaerostipes sp. Marseille-Q3525]